MSENKQTTELFQGLILSLSAGVMQHLGKTLNPMTQKNRKEYACRTGYDRYAGHAGGKNQRQSDR